MAAARRLQGNKHALCICWQSWICLRHEVQSQQSAAQQPSIPNNRKVTRGSSLEYKIERQRRHTTQVNGQAVQDRALCIEAQKKGRGTLDANGKASLGSRVLHLAQVVAGSEPWQELLALVAALAR